MLATVLGLGEAGGRYAGGLAAAGWRINGFDPAVTSVPPGVVLSPSARESVRGAELVISLTGAGASVAVADEIAADLAEGACLADFNTAAPLVKVRVANALRGTGASMADIAVLAPVPLLGWRAPLLASGPGAPIAARLLKDVGVPVEVIDGPVGTAAGRKLLRSVFMKGIAAAVLEALEAGTAAGCEEWVRDQAAAQLGSSLVDRLVEGSRIHADRRVQEVQAARDYLSELDVPTDICCAAALWLQRLNDQRARVP